MRPRALCLVPPAFVLGLTSACANPEPPPSVQQPWQEIEPSPPPPADKSQMIRVRSPQPDALVKSPLHVVGEARGGWYFEATFPVALFDDRGRELVRHYAQAQGEWMTEEFVPFELDLVFAAGDAQYGTLVLEKANPAGSIEDLDALKIPVRLSAKARRRR